MMKEARGYCAEIGVSSPSRHDRKTHSRSRKVGAHKTSRLKESKRCSHGNPSADRLYLEMAKLTMTPAAPQYESATR